jgi:hypothetical protein
MVVRVVVIRTTRGRLSHRAGILMMLVCELASDLASQRSQRKCVQGMLASGRADSMSG